MSKSVNNLFDLVRSGQRLGPDEYVHLYESDFHQLCAVADVIRTRLHGRKAYYINNRHINYTNVCVNSCVVCTFGRQPGAADAYTLSIDDIEKIAADSASTGVREFHVVGGLNPELKYHYYSDLLRTLRRLAPAAAVKAFTAVEIDFISKISGRTAQQVLAEFKALGLSSLPGGGAEIFNEQFRSKNFPNKISGPRWLEIHSIAHSLAIPTTATMLYNAGETIRDRVDHLLTLRAVQQQSLRNYGTAFTCFVPLSCKGTNTGPSSAVLDIWTAAIARIILDNISHIKAFVPILGIETAELALLCGADDLDGFVEDYKIVAQASRDRRHIRQVIAALGLEAMERGSLYETGV